MNYFPFHIGDYDSNTSHLTWIEDTAYSRMIRLYYRTEKPLPAKIEDVCRLVRALSGQERKAVSQVLNEFFVLHDDGWHNARCDAEIEKAKQKAERNRTVGKLGGRPKKSVTEMVNSDNPQETQTVISGLPKETLPITNNQEPITNNQEPIKATAATIPAVVPPTDKNPPPPSPGLEKTQPPAKAVDRTTQIAVLLRGWERDRGKSAKVTSATPQIREWASKGVTDAQLREAYELAVEMRKVKGDEGAINAGIVDTFLAQILNPPPGTSALHSIATGAKPWQASWSGIVAKGRELGIFQSEAEHPQAFKTRVFEAAQMTPEEKATLRADFGISV